MKPAFTTFLAVLALSVSAFAGSGRIYTTVIHDTDQPVSFALSSREYVKIFNFNQQGANYTDNGINTLATQNFGAVTVFQGASGLAGANVLYAAYAGTTRAEHEDIYIAGPAIINVAPLAGTVLVLTYFRGSN